MKLDSLDYLLIAFLIAIFATMLILEDSIETPVVEDPIGSFRVTVNGVEYLCEPVGNHTPTQATTIDGIAS
jgi:hypothetical protein